MAFGELCWPQTLSSFVRKTVCRLLELACPFNENKRATGIDVDRLHSMRGGLRLGKAEVTNSGTFTKQCGAKLMIAVRP